MGIKESAENEMKLRWNKEKPFAVDFCRSAFRSNSEMRFYECAFSDSRLTLTAIICTRNIVTIY